MPLPIIATGKFILKWLSGGVIGQVAGPLLEAHKVKLAAQTSEDKLAADITIQQLQNEAEARRGAIELRKASQGYPEQRFLTFCIGGIFTAHVVAVGLDTIFGFGWQIAAFPKPFDEWEGVIILSFFELQAGVVGVKVLAWAIGRRK